MNSFLTILRYTILFISQEILLTTEHRCLSCVKLFEHLEKLLAELCFCSFMRVLSNPLGKAAIVSMSNLYFFVSFIIIYYKFEILLSLDSRLINLD